MSEITPPPPPQPSFRIPADYYSDPVAASRPLFPRWLTLGCGWASVVFLILLFSGAAFFSGRGFGSLMHTVLGMLGEEMSELYTPAVTEQQIAALEAEMERLQENLRQGRVPASRLDGVVRTISEVSSDRSITPEETERLTRMVREINSLEPATRNP